MNESTYLFGQLGLMIFGFSAIALLFWSGSKIAIPMFISTVIFGLGMALIASNQPLEMKS